MCQRTGSNLFKPCFPVQTDFIEHWGSRIIAVSELFSIEKTQVLVRTIMAVSRFSSDLQEMLYGCISRVGQAVQ